MTPERQNEIWEYLPNNIRCELQCDYIKACEAQELDPRNERIDAHRMFLEKYFGKHNLTAQAEEKPKEPRFKVGDKVSYFGQVATIFKAHCNGYDVIFGNGAVLYNLPEVTFDPYTESNGESNHILNTTKMVDYAQYRLDLAKEIAVAMINNTGNTRYDNILPYAAVKMANEIVKRLKETKI